MSMENNGHGQVQSGSATILLISDSRRGGNNCNVHSNSPQDTWEKNTSRRRSDPESDGAPSGVSVLRCVLVEKYARPDGIQVYGSSLGVGMEIS